MKQSWAIDPTHSTVEFAVKKLFFFTVPGSLEIESGELVLDPTDVHGSSVRVVMRAASIDTANQKRDAHLRAAAFLDADHYPELRFQSTRVEPGTDRDTLRVTGALTIREQSRAVVLEVSDIDRSRSPSGEYIAYYSGRTEVDRFAFGINHWGWLIGRTLRITINVQAVRRGE